MMVRPQYCFMTHMDEITLRYYKFKKK